MRVERKQYSAEFKREAVRLVTDKGLSLAQAARDLGINDNLLSRWKKQLESTGAQAFPGQGQPRDEELARLRREVEVLRQERDILKKAVGIFSQAPR
ncbi:MAG: transposase [bacterium]|nr:transposase [bacterium]